jgi:hypothetical protein
VRWFTVALFIAFCTPSVCSAQEIKILSPKHDVVVSEDEIIVTGMAEGPAGTKVELRTGLQKRVVDVVNGQWSVPGVKINDELAIEARYGTAIDRVLVTRGTNLVPKRRATVEFLWRVGVDKEIETIALKTVDKQPDQRQLKAFVAGVKTQTLIVFARAFVGVNIEVVQGPAKNTTHTVELVRKVAPGVFGRSYGTDLEILVGSFRLSMTGEFAKWSPMEGKDGWEVRMIDLAEALGRTAAHEFAHSIGLVAPATDKKNGWMNGSSGYHNNSDASALNPLAIRFDNGFFIMDSGEETLNRARIGERQTTRTERRPASFNSFNSSILQIIYP